MWCSFEPSGSCTHTASLNHFNLNKLGGVPYNTYNSVLPQSACVDIQSFSLTSSSTASHAVELSIYRGFDTHLQDYNSAQGEAHMHLQEEEGDDGTAGGFRHSTEGELMFPALRRLHLLSLILSDLFLQHCLHLLTPRHATPRACVSLRALYLQLQHHACCMQNLRTVASCLRAFCVCECW